jgi:hypothetical protein
MKPPEALTTLLAPPKIAPKPAVTELPIPPATTPAKTPVTTLL